ncbi:MAG: hypothetical protein F6K00_26775 [Leptolyngbya sp. SIOISBB]|nr:hypothetical protein [Leptolyngbya sp. SIOISBB]
MTEAIISAIITGIAGPIITYYFTTVLPSKVYPKISTASQSNLNGRWNGSGYQQYGPQGETLEHTFSVTFHCGKRKIAGNAIMHVAVDNAKFIMHYKIDGIFFEDRIVSFTYRNTDSKVRQYGSAVLELDTPGQKLRGLIIGYGFLSKSIVEVRVELEKTA